MCGGQPRLGAVLQALMEVQHWGAWGSSARGPLEAAIRLKGGDGVAARGWSWLLPAGNPGLPGNIPGGRAAVHSCLARLSWHQCKMDLPAALPADKNSHYSSGPCLAYPNSGFILVLMHAVTPRIVA
ncbi:hypothetical protein NDU88_010527 [Pleurodeles waltl]|uniref:Uncharacterized protein n=1 Tax=Pleurodeles waltl TaxID=8319 RepID=A0AAV7QUR8_PLEWA|nr:hypothetical protein NDU88_010527 [Pleurodeles waltl]